jgi:hypothetical protein
VFVQKGGRVLGRPLRSPNMQPWTKTFASIVETHRTQLLKVHRPPPRPPSIPFIIFNCTVVWPF